MKYQISHDKLIEGLRYSVCQEGDYEEVNDFYWDVFEKDEPSTMSFGGWKKRHDGMDKLFADIVNDGVSVIVRDPSNENKLVGFRISHIVKRGAIDERGDFSFYRKLYPDSHATIMTLFDELMYPGDVFSAHPDKNQMYDMYGLGVLEEYRGRGIATKLVQEALEVARKAGCDCAVAMCSNDLSRRIFNKLGMTMFAKKPWEQCCYDNVQVFGNVKSEYMSSHYMSLT